MRFTPAIVRRSRVLGSARDALVGGSRETIGGYQHLLNKYFNPVSFESKEVCAHRLYIAGEKFRVISS